MIAIDGLSSTPLALNPGRVKDALAGEAIKRLTGMPMASVAAAIGELDASDGQDAGGGASDSTRTRADDRVHLDILRGQALMLERRWQDILASRFRAWPAKPRPGALCLLSEGLLESQMLGQPVSEALDRRFATVLAVVGNRYQALARLLDATDESHPPTAPASLVEALLQLFPANECPRHLRQRLLRHFHDLAGTQLGGFYDWLNGWMASHGVAMSGSDRHGLQIAPRIGTAPPGSFGAATPAERPGPMALQATALGIFRAARRAIGAVEGDPGDDRRALTDSEFQAVLQLLQSEDDRDALGSPPATYASLSRAMLDVSSSLGIDNGSVGFSIEQRDAMAAVTLILGDLKSSAALDSTAEAALDALVLPYLLALWQSPAWLDDAAHPARTFLGAVLEAWDGVPASATCHATARDAAAAVVAEFNGDMSTFTRHGTALRSGMATLSTRTLTQARRTFQSMEGRERRQAAQRAVQAIQARLVLPAKLRAPVSRFLFGTWPAALERVWLLKGPRSEEFQHMEAAGAKIIEADGHANAAAGGDLADLLVCLEGTVRDAFRICGADDAQVEIELGSLVASLADPDTPGVAPPVLPLVDEDVEPAPVPCQGLPDEGGWVVLRGQGTLPSRALQLVGITGLRRRYFFVDNHGGAVTLSQDAVAAAVSCGRMRRRDDGGLLAERLRALAGT